MSRCPGIYRKPVVQTIAAFLFLLAGLTACDWTSELRGDNDDDDDNTPPAADTDIAGLNVAVTAGTIDDIYNDLLDDIAAQTGFVVQVDHEANAASVDRSLRPTRLVVFDNPDRSAPLIQADARAGLDLPAKLLVYRDGEGDTAVAYNDPDYLDARYDLDDQDDVLAAIDDNLRMLAQDAAGSPVSREGSNAGIDDGEGIVTVESGNGFAVTLNNLVSAIAARPNLTLVTQIDQQANAASVGLGVNPSVLLLFANPDVDTQLMRSAQTAGIDLPQKMLVSQADDGSVSVYYNDPDFIAARHDIVDRDDELDDIADLLDDLATAATTAATVSP